MDVGGVVPERRAARRRAVEDDPLAHEHDPLDDVLDGAELVRDVEDRDAELVAELLEQAASASCASTSTPVVGSSSTSSVGCAASALAMNARCCWPPESALQRPARQSREPDALDRLGRRRRGRRGAAGRSGRSGARPASTTSRTVTGACTPSCVALREVADARPVAEAPRRLAEERTSPARRPLEAEREPQQRRLAAAVRAGDRDELALLDAQVDVSQHRRPLAVGEVDAVELER